MDIKEIAESVFRLCREENENEASVERIVNFFKKKRDVEQWRLCNKEVDLLYDLLDPQASRAGVSLSMLEIGLHKWVQYIRFRSSDDDLPLDSVDDYGIFDQCTFSKLPEQTPQEVAGASSEQPGDSGMPLSEHLDTARPGVDEFGEVSYVSGAHARGDGREGPEAKEHFESGADFSSYNDVADILSRLHQIRHENCVLLDEKKKLQIQLEAAEDNIQQQQAQLSEWEKKNRSFQSVSREYKELQKEVEELRGNIEVLENANRELRQAQAQTERDVAYWQERADEYSNMLSRRQQEMDQRNKSIEELKRSLMEHKEAIEECNIFGRSQQLELENKGMAVHQLNEMVEQLNEKSEQLLRQKEEQDSQLHWYKSEVQRLRLSFSGVSQEGGLTKEKEHSQTHDRPRKCSTPHRLESLQSELFAGMSEDAGPDLPSPFCEKASSLSQLSASRSFDLSALGTSRDSLMSLDELEPKTMLELEIDFLKLMNSVPLDAELKEKCIDVFKGVLNLHQRQCTKLTGELRQIREQKGFVQSRYQEALQQLRDTSCLLETDIADKMASLEEQIKAEQVYRLDMEAQLSKYRAEEEFRMTKKDISTQAKMESPDLTKNQSEDGDSTSSFTLDKTLHEISTFQRTESSKFNPSSSDLLCALDLASRSKPSFSPAPELSRKKMHQLLPDFDMEFSYSFDTPHHVPRKPDGGGSTSDTPSTTETKGEEDSMASVRSFRPSRSREGPALQDEEMVSPTSTPTISSSISWQSGQPPVDSSLKESDGSEERENVSTTTTTTSSVEDLVVPCSRAMTESMPVVSVRRRALSSDDAHHLAVAMSELPGARRKSSVSVSLPGVAEEESGAGTMATDSSTHSEAETKLEEDDVFCDTESSSQRAEPRPDAPKAAAVFPSLPDSKLKEMELLSESLDSLSWSEEEAEQKFTHLSLAFRTDRETLEERIKLHRWGRDNAERNAKSEIDAIRQVVTGLSQIPNLSVEIIANLQYTCKVLEQSIHRLASKSEILGAVQQVLEISLDQMTYLEDRLSHAVDVMLHHMSNLRRSHAKDSRELEEARRILKANASDGAGDSMSKRSLSLVGGGSPVKPLRRTSTTSRKSTVSTDSHELRSRFQAGPFNASFQSSVTHHFRRLSTDKYEPHQSVDLSGVPRFPSNESNSGPLSHESNGRIGKLSNASDITVSTTAPEKDAIFQKGLEQGLRAQVGNELGTLREEQASLTESLDYLMEVHSLLEEDFENEDSYDKRDFVDFLISKGSDFLSTWKYNISFLRARWIAGAAAFAVAVFILLWSVLWSVTVRHPSSAPS